MTAALVATRSVLASRQAAHFKLSKRGVATLTFRPNMTWHHVTWHGLHGALERWIRQTEVWRHEGHLNLPRNSKNVAFITGVTGQDGSLLAELLLGKGYVVHGIVRRSSSFNTDRIAHLSQDAQDGSARFVLHYGDMTDATNMIRLIKESRPTEVYNLAAQSHVHVSFQAPEYTANADGLGALRLLEAIRCLDMEKHVRFYQASTSELYGQSSQSPQNENTPFYPRSPYAIAKLYAYWTTVNYRESYGLHASNGILFNHESPTRGDTFVSRKISLAAAAIKTGRQKRLYLGNLNAKRDWGHARDYVRGMWLMLQQDTPGDYVLATGEAHSVREFVEVAFGCLDMSIEWRGHGVHEKGYDVATGRCLIEIDSQFFRPAEADFLVGDATKARTDLGWHHTISFEQLVQEMTESSLAAMNADSGARLPRL